MLRQERILLKIALIVSLIGLLMLIIITGKSTEQAKTIPLSEIQNKENDKVTVKGTITSIKDTPVILILEIQDHTTTAKVIANKKELQQKLKKGMTIQVTGTVKEYQEEKEIEASNIQILSKV